MNEFSILLSVNTSEIAPSYCNTLQDNNQQRPKIYVHKSPFVGGGGGGGGYNIAEEEHFIKDWFYQ